MSIIFHIDVNSAYLSWTAVEQLKNGKETDIRTIPAIIGGDQKSRHGVVLAKSVPAKKYGIHTGEPVANAFRKCPNLVMEPPDHRLYSAYSRRLMDFLKTYTPDIEQVSVDECYMDFTGIASRYYSPVTAALEIKDEAMAHDTLYVQQDLFSAMNETTQKLEDERLNSAMEGLKKENRAQMAILEIQKKYGKNSIMKGMSLQEDATMRERNQQIGGHKA